MREVTIDGVRFVEAAPAGKRAVVIIDRGWIIAGDVTEANGRITLSRAVHVRRWDGVGFDGMLANPKDPKVQLRPLGYEPSIPAGSEVFRVSVPDSWGL